MVSVEYLTRSDIWLITFRETVVLRDLYRAVRRMQKETAGTTFQLVRIRTGAFSFSPGDVRRLETTIGRGFGNLGFAIEAYVAIVADDAPVGRAYASMYRSSVRAPGYHVQVFDRGAQAVRWLRLFQARSTDPDGDPMDRA